MVIFVFDPDCDIEIWHTTFTSWKILVTDGPSLCVINEFIEWDKGIIYRKKSSYVGKLL